MPKVFPKLIFQIQIQIQTQKTNLIVLYLGSLSFFFCLCSYFSVNRLPRRSNSLSSFQRSLCSSQRREIKFKYKVKNQNN